MNDALGAMARRGALTLVGVALLAAGPLAARAQPNSLTIELNKVESTDEGCRTLFVFDNRTGHELDRFRVDLILFDQEGVYQRQVLLDMAPLYADKKSVASFLVADGPCDEIGSILVNDIPQCKDGVGESLDCVELLQVHSRSDIPLEK
jgi:hypothetical protein